MTSTTAPTNRATRTSSWLAIAAGAAWVLGVTLVATQASTDPVGSSYDAANRILGVAIALLLASALAARARDGGRARTVVVAGTALMLAGSLLEFVVLPLLGGTPDATAERLGSDTSVLSPIGFAMLVLGTLVVAVGCVARAVSLRHQPALRRIVVGLTGPLLAASTIVWAVSPAVAAAVSAAAAAAWWSASLATR